MNDTDLDRDLLHELKDLKGLMDRDTVEEHKEWVWWWWLIMKTI